MTRALRRWALVAALVALPARAEWKGGSQNEVPLDGNGHSWLVKATLNGSVSGLFLLDTGASVCVLAPGTAQRLGIGSTSEHVDLRTANGVVHAPLVHLRSIDVGGNRVHDVAAVVHSAVAPPADGVIGLSFLNSFSSYGIDPRRRVLVLH